MPSARDGGAGDFTARPLTEGTLADLEELFGLPGGLIVRGCWCMFYRRTGRAADGPAAEIKAANKRALRGLVSGGTVPGLIEAYPVDKPERSHDDFMFFGSRSLYERAGFREVVRRSPTRVVMRRDLAQPGPPAAGR
jgi:hypothetical protein